MQDELLVSVPVSRTNEDLVEYFLVAHPDEKVNKKIAEERKNFYALYEQKPLPKTKSEITIARFFAKEEMEDTVTRYIERICNQQYSFNVMLNNYSGSPTGSIFLRVQNPEPFQQFAKELKYVNEYVSSCSCPPVTVCARHHVTIGKKLPESLFIKAMIDYSRRSFNETFMVDQLVLFKRIGKTCETKCTNVFRLKP